MKTKGYKKIYIVGSVASGKMALAKLLSQRLGIPWYELDKVFWLPCSAGDVKRPDGDRDKLFETILRSKHWIIEDVLRPCFEKGLRSADVIILLDPPKRKRGLPALFRWIGQNIRIEKSRHTPTINVLKSVHRWIWDFERNKSDFMKRIEPYRAKLITIRSPEEIEQYII